MLEADIGPVVAAVLASWAEPGSRHADREPGQEWDGPGQRPDLVLLHADTVRRHVIHAFRVVKASEVLAGNEPGLVHEAAGMVANARWLAVIGAPAPDIAARLVVEARDASVGLAIQGDGAAILAEPFPSGGDALRFYPGLGLEP